MQEENLEPCLGTEALEMLLFIILLPPANGNVKVKPT